MSKHEGVKNLALRINIAHKLLVLFPFESALWDNQLIRINALELDFWFLTGISYRDYGAESLEVQYECA